MAASDEPGGDAGDAGAGAARVERTGIALVHEGEYVLPAPGSEAVVTHHAGGGTVVHYHFPVEVEVVGTLQDHHLRRIADHVFDTLDSELGSRG